LVREPLFVPESANVSRLLRDLQRTRQHLAMVVDEYGGIVGLVTLDDAIGRIVGEIRERAGGPGEPTMARLADGSIVVDGLVRIEELKRAFGIPIEESQEYSTVAGFILTLLNTIPNVGATFTHDGHRWTVLQVEGPRIKKVKIERTGSPS
jgi:putative hemolysin